MGNEYWLTGQWQYSVARKATVRLEYITLVICHRLSLTASMVHDRAISTPSTLLCGVVLPSLHLVTAFFQQDVQVI